MVAHPSSTVQMNADSCLTKDAIISIVSTAQLIACLPQMPEYPDPFQIRFIQIAKATREVHDRILERRLPQTHETGTAVGILAQGFGLSADLLHLFVDTIVKEWRFTGMKWEDNQNFTQGVVKGFDKPHNRSFENFYKSLQTFALTRSRSDPETEVIRHDLKSPKPE